MISRPPKTQIARKYLVMAISFAVVVSSIALTFASSTLPDAPVELTSLNWNSERYPLSLPVWFLTFFAAAIGACATILASLLDHKNQTLRPIATQDADRATVCYLLIRIPSAIALGVVAAYFSSKAEFDIFSDQKAAIPVVAFAAAYLSNVSKLLKR